MRKLVMSVGLALVLLLSSCFLSDDSIIRSLVLGEDDFPSMIDKLAAKTDLQFAPGADRSRLDELLGVILYSCLYNLDENLSRELNDAGISFHNADLGIPKSVAGARIASIYSSDHGAEDKHSLTYEVEAAGSLTSLYQTLLELANKELGEPVYKVSVAREAVFRDGNLLYEDPFSTDTDLEMYLFSLSPSIFFYIDPVSSATDYISLTFCTREALFDVCCFKEYGSSRKETAV